MNEEALALENLFVVLANDTRLRLLHELARQGEACTSELADALELKPQAVSNQLARLQDKGIVARRRQGNHVPYRIVDSCVAILLERGLGLIEETEGRSAEAGSRRSDSNRHDAPGFERSRGT